MFHEMKRNNKTNRAHTHSQKGVGLRLRLCVCVIVFPTNERAFDNLCYPDWNDLILLDYTKC